MAIKFLYFDLGKVLVDFDIQRMCRQMADTAGIDQQRVVEVLFNDHLQLEYELGRLSDREFYEAFCERTGTRPDYEELAQAASDFFDLNVSVLPVVTSLQQTRQRLGILSNTCPLHWEHCTRRYRIVAEAFPVHVLSYQVGVVKPGAKLFEVAAQKAGVAPSEIFFVDDILENVAGARSAGFDAVQFTTVAQLAADLRRRGIPLNY